jgi:hypothetical protein
VVGSGFSRVWRSHAGELPSLNDFGQLGEPRVNVLVLNLASNRKSHTTQHACLLSRKWTHQREDVAQGRCGLQCNPSNKAWAVSKTVQKPERNWADTVRMQAKLGGK